MKKDTKKTDWYTIEEIAKEMEASESYIRNQIKTNKLRSFKSGRVIRIHADWISEWIKAGLNYGNSI